MCSKQLALLKLSVRYSDFQVTKISMFSKATLLRSKVPQHPKHADLESTSHFLLLTGKSVITVA